MQSDAPTTAPRRQRIDGTPLVATGYMDPCIISLETTLPGEIPMLVHLWAASCQEMRAPGFRPHWALTDVVILKSFYHKPNLLRSCEWSFRNSRKKSAVFFPGAVRSTRFSGLPELFDYLPEHIYQWHIRYLDCAIDTFLRQVVTWHPDQPQRLAPVLLTHSGVDWPSVTEAAAFAAKANTAGLSRRRRATRPSLARRLFSSIFQHKKKLVAA